MSDTVPGITRDGGERRIVTVLFADLVSSTEVTLNLDPEEAQALLDRSMALMASAIREFGGFVMRYQGDGVMASFGVPESAEDHALRACFAGMAIQRAFRADQTMRDSRGNPLQVRVGINSGLVITRELSSDVGTTLDIAGPSVSLAALAEKVCQVGAVTATSATVDLAGSLVSHRPLEPDERNVAGVRFFEILDASLEYKPDENGDAPGFVGREKEENVFAEALDNLNAGGRVYTVLGEAGIGKTRLSDRVGDLARKRQMPVYRVSAYSLTAASPYLPMRQLLHRLLELSREASSVDADIAMNLAGLNLLLGAQINEFLTGSRSQRSALLSNEGSATSMLPGLLAKAIVSILGESRSLVIIEDLHYLDSETLFCLKQISQLASSSTKTLFLFTSRLEAREQVARLNTLIMVLKPLSDAALRELVSSQCDSVGEDTIAQLVARSGGVPLVLEQLVRAVTSPGVRADIGQLPSKVESLVHTRLYRLPDHTKSVAQQLSVLDDEFEFELALHFLGLDEEKLKRIISELESTGFLEIANSSTIRFKHSVIRECCLDSLLMRERHPLHARALRSLEQFYKTSPVYERLAHHAEQSHQDEVALEYYWVCFKQAAQQSAVHSLSVLYERAIACCERIGVGAEPTEVDIVLLAFDAMQQHGKIAAVVPRLQRASEIASKLNRPDKQSLALTHLSTVFWFQANYPAGLYLAENAVTLAVESGSLPAVFYSRFTLANLQHGCGNIRGAVTELDDLSTLLTGELETAYLGAIGLPSVMCRSFLGWYLTELGDFSQVRQHLDKAREIACQADKPYTTVIAHVSEGRLLLETGEVEAALEVLEPLHELCLKHRIFAMDPVVTGLLTAALTVCGEHKRALEMTTYSIEKQYFKSAARHSWYFLFSSHAAALSANGRDKEALICLKRVVTANDNPVDPANLAQSLVRLGYLLLKLGNETEALRAFKRSLLFAEQCGMLPTLARTHFGLSLCPQDTEATRTEHEQAGLKIYNDLGLDANQAFFCLRTQ